MNVLCFVIFKLFKFLIEFFKPEKEIVIPVVEAFSYITNIFAWANALVPADTILLLMSISASFLIYKNILRMVKTILFFLKP